MLDALAAGTDRPPVPARFARSAEEEDAVTPMTELSRGTGQRRSTT